VFLDGKGDLGFCNLLDKLDGFLEVRLFIAMVYGLDFVAMRGEGRVPCFAHEDLLVETRGMQKYDFRLLNEVLPFFHIIVYVTLQKSFVFSSHLRAYTGHDLFGSIAVGLTATRFLANDVF